MTLVVERRVGGSLWRSRVIRRGLMRVLAYAGGPNPSRPCPMRVCILTYDTSDPKNALAGDDIPADPTPYLDGPRLHDGPSGEGPGRAPDPRTRPGGLRPLLQPLRRRLGRGPARDRGGAGAGAPGRAFTGATQRVLRALAGGHEAGLPRVGRRHARVLVGAGRTPSARRDRCASRSSSSTPAATPASASPATPGSRRRSRSRPGRAR